MTDKVKADRSTVPRRRAPRECSWCHADAGHILLANDRGTAAICGDCVERLSQRLHRINTLLAIPVELLKGH